MPENGNSLWGRIKLLSNEKNAMDYLRVKP